MCTNNYKDGFEQDMETVQHPYGRELSWHLCIGFRFRLQHLQFLSHPHNGKIFVDAEVIAQHTKY